MLLPNQTKSQGSSSNGAHDGNYAGAALERECAAVTSAQPGTRNGLLNQAAFNLGQLVAGGLLNEGQVHDRLYSAAIACGLLKDDGPAAVEKTIASGLSAGMENHEARRRQKQQTQSIRSAGNPPVSKIALQSSRQPARQPFPLCRGLQPMDVLVGLALETESTLCAFDEARKLCRKAGTATAKTVAAVVTLARSDRTIAATVDQWDRDPWSLNTDATYDLRTGIARAPNPLDYLTLKTACDAAPPEPRIRYGTPSLNGSRPRTSSCSSSAALHGL